MVAKHKYLGAHLKNKLNWTGNTDVSTCPCTGRAKVASICWGDWGPLACRGHYFKHYMTLWWHQRFFMWWPAGEVDMDRDRKRPNKLVRRTSSVLDCPLNSRELVGDQTVEALSSSISSRLLHPLCKEEHYCRTFIPTTIRLFNSSTTWTITFHSLCFFVNMLFLSIF